MDETLYIRVRGRVQGPFDREKLQLLVRRGQLSRIHEVSPDGATWRKAADYPDLFVAAAPVSTSAPHNGNQQSGATAAASAAMPAEQQWYYAVNGTQQGPVRFVELQQLAALGQLAPGDLVWCEGMAEWTPAQSVPGLLPAQASTSSEDVPQKKSTRRVDDECADEGKLTDHLARSAADAQAWVMLIAVFGYVYAGLMILGGMLLLLGIADNQLNAGFLGTVLMWLLYAGVTITGSVLLSLYHNAMSRFIQTRSEKQLDLAMRRLRSFWVFAGIVLIVITANIIIGAIFVFSAAASLAGIFT